MQQQVTGGSSGQLISSQQELKQTAAHWQLKQIAYQWELKQTADHWRLKQTAYQ
jgi:hypothetical protein